MAAAERPRDRAHVGPLHMVGEDEGNRQVEKFVGRFLVGHRGQPPDAFWLGAEASQDLFIGNA
jgi:hypothetical protein